MNFKGKNNNEDQSNDSKMLKSLDSAQDLLQVKGARFRPVGAAVTLGVRKQLREDLNGTLYFNKSVNKSVNKTSSNVE